VCALWTKDDKDDASRKRRLVLDLLEDIRDQRAKLKLDFEESVTSIKEITATLMEFDDQSLTVEVSALKGASGTWIGAEVTTFFRIHDRETRGREQFLTFDTRITGVEQRPSGMVHFIMALPETVKSAQLRRSVRVGVDPRKVPTLKVWRELPSGSMVSDAKALLDSETDATRGLKVDNFSANGMRLLVGNALMHEALPEQRKGEHFSFHFRAVAEPGAPAATFWVNAILRNIFNDTHKGETALGFEFISEGFIDETRRLVWRPLRFDEVGGLGKFIFKWNLDLYREKGIGGA
jgi:c-di-GMP-binding flagellar brake protein YcgR